MPLYSRKITSFGPSRFLKPGWEVEKEQHLGLMIATFPNKHTLIIVAKAALKSKDKEAREWAHNVIIEHGFSPLDIIRTKEKE